MRGFRTRTLPVALAIALLLLGTGLSLSSPTTRSAAGAPVSGAAPIAAGFPPSARPAVPASELGPLPAVLVDHGAPPLGAIRGASTRAAWGITDAGVTDNETASYSYSTSAFMGTLDIQAMDAEYLYTYHNTTYDYAGNTIQLNAVLVLSNGTNLTAFWIQDVPFFEPPDDGIALEDNIWNLSSSDTLQANSVVGYGGEESAGGGVTIYADSANTTLPGNDLDLGFPANVSALVVTGTASGVPYVDFEYNDGYGWQTYDNATFPWAANGWTNDGFVVDGSMTTPLGLYYDAEWVYGGPGGGLDSTNVQANFTMTLQYWNGHNFQAVPNAINVALDTGEAMQDVLDSPGIGEGAGMPSATITVGTSTPGFLYQRSQIALVNITSYLPDATITVGGASYPFQGTDANVTLAPGTYSFTLWADGKAVESQNASLTAGEYLALEFATPPKPSAVAFDASGLPVGVEWHVVVGNTTYTSSNASISLELLNGTYAYAVVPVPGYYLSSYAGTFRVAGRSVTLSVHWSVYVLPVSIQAVGLPDGIAWSVDLTPLGASVGAEEYGNGSGTLSAELANGSYAVSVSVPYLYEAVLGDDSITVQGAAVEVEVQFGVRESYLVGTVGPTGAVFTIDGTVVPLGANGSYNETLTPGTYDASASRPGDVSVNETVVLTPGNATSLNLTLQPVAHSGGAPSNPQSPSSPFSTEVLLGLGLAVAVALLGAAILVRRRRPT